MTLLRILLRTWFDAFANWHRYDDVDYTEVVLSLLQSGIVGTASGVFFQLPWMRRPVSLVMIRWHEQIEDNIGGRYN